MSSDKFIGFFRLVSACESRRCPLCTCLAEDNRRALDAILDHVTDPQSRRELYAAWGLCNWHAIALVDGGGGVTGGAILLEDLLRRCGERFAGFTPAPVSPPSLWTRLVAKVRPRRPPAVLTEYRERLRCGVCLRLSQSERAYVQAVVRFSDDPQFTVAYERSSGCCVPHLAAVIAEAQGVADVGAIVGTTRRKWDDLRKHLAAFVEKHEYRATEAISDVEAQSYRRAAEMLAGLPHLFGNDVPRGLRTPKR